MGLMNNGVVYALWDYSAEFSDELSFREGEPVTVLRRDGQEELDWWWASLYGQEGYVPKNYFGVSFEVGEVCPGEPRTRGQSRRALCVLLSSHVGLPALSAVAFLAPHGPLPFSAVPQSEVPATEDVKLQRGCRWGRAGARWWDSHPCPASAGHPLLSEEHKRRGRGAIQPFHTIPLLLSPFLLLYVNPTPQPGGELWCLPQQPVQRCAPSPKADQGNWCSASGAWLHWGGLGFQFSSAPVLLTFLWSPQQSLPSVETPASWTSSLGSLWCCCPQLTVGGTFNIFSFYPHQPGEKRKMGHPLALSVPSWASGERVNCCARTECRRGGGSLVVAGHSPQELN